MGFRFRSIFNPLRYLRVPMPISLMYVWGQGVHCEFVTIIFLKNDTWAIVQYSVTIVPVLKVLCALLCSISYMALDCLLRYRIMNIWTFVPFLKIQACVRTYMLVKQKVSMYWYSLKKFVTLCASIWNKNKCRWWRTSGFLDN